jgi:peptidoglycan/LPS O-acetylase OafA/YrhL
VQQAYRPDIDGLRGIAVLAVVAHHAFPGLLPGGFVGVDIFFVISGYLITGDIVARQAAGTFTLADFYRRRVRRIFPALIVVLIATAAIGSAILLADEFVSLLKHTAASALFVQNFNLLQEVGYFDTEAKYKPLLHLWSLAVEEQFYIVWPLALMVCPVAWRLRMTAGLIACSLGAMLAIDAAAAYYLPFTRFWQIMAGAALAITGYRRGLSVLGIVLCLIAFALASPMNGDMPLMPVLPTLGAVCLLASQVRWPRWLIGVGLISYPLYLWHWPLLAFVAINGGDTLHIVLACLAAFVLAFLTYRMELPIRRSRFFVKPLLAGMVGVATATAALASTDFQLQAGRETAKVNDLRTVEPQGPSCGTDCISEGRDFLLLGDSHAQALFVGIQKVQPGRWTLIHRNGCAPADVKPIGNMKCRPLEEVLHTDIPVVVLAFRDHYPELPAAIGKTVESLSGKRVLILTSVPDLPFRPRDCIRFGDCTFARPEVEGKQAAMRAAIKASGAEMVDVLDALCDGPRCAVDRGDLLMYRDGDHLSARGAEIVARHVIASIK